MEIEISGIILNLSRCTVGLLASILAKSNAIPKQQFTMKRGDGESISRKMRPYSAWYNFQRTRDAPHDTTPSKGKTKFKVEL